MMNHFRKLIFRIKQWIISRETHTEMPQLDIKSIRLDTNPKYDPKKPWGKRSISMINKIIVHQAMADASTEAIHKYHTGPDSHLKSGGAPRIAYHYTIEKDGTVFKVNSIEDVTWHCRGQNIESIGILMLGNFTGPTYIGKSEPTPEQLKSLGLLLDHLRDTLKFSNKDVFGHCDFGKENCPGNKIMARVKRYRGDNK